MSIIVLLSSVVLASLTTARERGFDIRRIQDASAISRALELYFDDTQTYPVRDAAQSGGGPCSGNDSAGNLSWCGLVDDLAQYIVMPSDPINTGNYVYRYDADTDNTASYGLMMKMQSRASDNFVNNDGGFYNTNGGTEIGEYYEIGDQPSYCVRTYSESWWTGGSANVCATN